MAHKQPVSVLVMIYTPQLDVLLLERADRPGFWQSVTGSREGEETLRETAIREVFEETGLETDIGAADPSAKTEIESKFAAVIGLANSSADRARVEKAWRALEAQVVEVACDL